jgi:hypothetical protein
LVNFDQDTFALDAERRALVRAAVLLLRADPKHAIGVFPVYTDRSSRWEQRYLLFPDERGVLEYSVDEYERVIVLYRVQWGAR